MCKRANTRWTHGSLLADKANVQQWIADSRIEIDATRLAVMHAAWMIDTVGKREARQEIARGRDSDFDQKPRFLGIHPRNQCGHFRPRNMVANSNRQSLRRGGEIHERSFVSQGKIAREIEESGAPGRELDVARRPLDQSAIQPIFKPLELQADRGLRYP